MRKATVYIPDDLYARIQSGKPAHMSLTSYIVDCLILGMAHRQTVFSPTAGSAETVVVEGETSHEPPEE